MKKALSFLLILLCFTVFTTEAAARTMAPKPPKAMKVERFTGRVTSVSIPDMTMVAESKKAGMTFDLGAARFKGYHSINNIKEGDRVTVQYVMKEGRAIARVVNKNRSYNYR